MKKKLLSIFLCMAVFLTFLIGCGINKKVEVTNKENVIKAEDAQESNLAGTHVFVFKSTDNSFGELLYEGFAEYLTAKGEKTIYRSPAETTVEAQVAIMEEMITQNVASITISTNGDTGYEEVFQKAQMAGIPIISVDSEVSPEYRVCHINQASTEDIGACLVQAAVLITLGIDYPGQDSDLKAVVEDALASYTGKEIRLGVLSASIDTPIQNQWIDAMKKELSDVCYAGKVSGKLDIKYGNDDFTESVIQADAFVMEDFVDCIIAPTTVGIKAAGQVLINYESDIKITGLGLPSEMQAFMPGTKEDDAFAFACPYMMLWDVVHLGATAGAATYAAVNEEFTGETGTSFVMDAFRDYEQKTYTVYRSGNGSVILAGVPYVFYKENMEKWVNIL